MASINDVTDTIVMHNAVDDIIHHVDDSMLYTKEVINFAPGHTRLLGLCRNWYYLRKGILGYLINCSFGWY